MKKFYGGSCGLIKVRTNAANQQNTSQLVYKLSKPAKTFQKNADMSALSRSIFDIFNLRCTRKATCWYSISIRELLDERENVQNMSCNIFTQ
ncbi:hypothetical protein CWC33_12285 [Idiomarina sp. X4]|nr:hypothetical protein CWC33_12285 [Idiomarina sp. X4]